ncbi:hypothetical protein BH23CHL2_BH23CHL2_23810 [soil metagenome]
MSGNQPATPQQRELEIMRVLFDRRLKDRAIALADSRWPGSGKMVDLAYEWGELEPTERRERLSAIGPEEIARLREFAELNPELSKAVTELDRRGVLPHLEAAAVDVAAAAREAQEPSEPATAESTEPAAETTNGAATEAPKDQGRPRWQGPDKQQPVYDFENADLAGLNVDMPDLDLGLPSTEEFLSNESDRRQEASRAAEEAMERVRKNLDQATQRAFQRSASFGMPKMPEVTRPTLPSIDTAIGPPAPSQESGKSTGSAVDAPASLAKHLKNHVVAIVGPDDPRPTDDQLVSLANDLQVGFTEHTISLGNRKEVFGTLVNEFGHITVRPGTIPKAIAKPNLLVVRGRLSPQLAERIEAGFFDIPGTRASVKVHPKARVVVINNA